MVSCGVPLRRLVIDEPPTDEEVSEKVALVLLVGKTVTTLCLFRLSVL